MALSRAGGLARAPCEAANPSPNPNPNPNPYRARQPSLGELLAHLLDHEELGGRAERRLRPALLALPERLQEALLPERRAPLRCGEVRLQRRAEEAAPHGLDEPRVHRRPAGLRRRRRQTVRSAGGWRLRHGGGGGAALVPRAKTRDERRRAAAGRLLRPPAWRSVDWREGWQVPRRHASQDVPLWASASWRRSLGYFRT